MRTLDRSRPYGETYGPASHKYDQDGILFDTVGNEIGGAEAPAEDVAAVPEVMPEPEPALAPEPEPEPEAPDAV